MFCKSINGKCQVILVLVIILYAQAPVLGYELRVVRSISAPSVKTAGLAWDNGALWVYGYDVRGSETYNRLYKVDPSNGGILEDFPLYWPDDIGDLAFDGTYIWACRLYDNKISKINPDDGTVIESYEAFGRPAGMAFDGEYLWNVSDVGDHRGTLYKINPASFEVVAHYDLNVSNAWGLAYDGSHFWALDYSGPSGSMHLIDSMDGSVIQSYSWMGERIGLAWDGEYLWESHFGGYFSGGGVYRWGTIEQVEVPEPTIMLLFSVGSLALLSKRRP